MEKSNTPILRLGRILRPIEIITLLGFALSWLIVARYGRSYSTLFQTSSSEVLLQLNWLLPCLIARLAFALFGISPRRARPWYLAYFTLLTVVFFGSDLEYVLTEAQVLGKSYQAVSETNELVRINIVLFVGLYLLTLYRWRKDRDETLRVLRTQLQEALHVTRLMFSLLLCFAAYSNIKPLIPVINPRLFDAEFYRLDYLLCLGNDPFIFLNSIQWQPFQGLMQQSYFFFFFFIIFALTGTLLFGDARHFEKTISAFIIAYYLATVTYFIFPAVGPAFAEATAPIFESTNDNGLKRHLLSLYIEFCRNPQSADIRLFSGLAAFPSLHIAHCLLFLYYLWKVEKVIVFLLALPFVLLSVSTIYLGWHYVTDFYGGILIALLTVYAVRWMYPEAEENTTSD